MSDRNGKRAEGSVSLRVLKSHQVTGIGVALTASEQVAVGDLPSHSGEARGAMPSLAGTSEARAASAVLGAAREAEARAHAMERRAAAVLEEAEEAARTRLYETEQQIEEMLSRAVSAVEHIQSEARSRGMSSGHEEGYRAGLEVGKAEGEEVVRRACEEAEALRAAVMQEADAIRHEAGEQRNHLLETSRAQLLDLTFAIARQVLKAELTLQPESILPMLEAALSKLKGEEEPYLRVGSAVAALLEEHRGRLLAAIPGARTLVVEPDPGLQPGDFLVQSSQGMIDGRVQQQVTEIEESLTGER